MILILDIENTVQNPKERNKGNSPYIPGNKLVTVQGKVLDGEEFFYWFHHKHIEADIPANHAAVQTLLDEADLIVGHNIKYDLAWLKECGFTYEGAVWDTMIFEYLQAKGMKPQLTLEACAERRGTDSRKSSFMSDCFKQGLNTDEMPAEGLREYAMLDIYTTEELYIKQTELTDADTEYMKPALDLMNSFLPVLCDMERDGVTIDFNELDRLEKEYTAEYNQIESELNRIVAEVMGHQPFNIHSPEQLSQIVYGFKVKDKHKWADIFNIGTEIRNGVSKKKMPRSMSDSKVDRLIKDLTVPLFKTEAEQCDECFGKGFIPKVKKDGTPYKKYPKCKKCDGTGIIYTQTTERAGLRVKHPGSKFASAGGFSCSGDVIEIKLAQAEKKERLNKHGELCVDFLRALSRLGALSTYINTYIAGVRNNAIGPTLHTTYNQCITATGRLSTSSPTLQNWPRAGTFPLRKVFVSRWDGGSILSADFAQLEFRIAAYLSQCEAAIKFIEDGRDIHMVSAEFYNIDRQSAKSETFAPLFGRINDYAEHFYKTFPGIAEWHKKISEEALNTKQLRSPSGRIYSYPLVRRDAKGKVQPFTQIANYPVQGFATGDIVPAFIIDLSSRMKYHNAKSKIVLTVHDDITSDIYPGEEQLMIELYKESFAEIKNTIKSFFGVDINVPLDYDIAIGKNWMEKTEVN